MPRTEMECSDIRLLIKRHHKIGVLSHRQHRFDEHDDHRLVMVVKQIESDSRSAACELLDFLWSVSIGRIVKFITLRLSPPCHE